MRFDLSLRIQVVSGALLTAAGVADLAGAMPALADYAYAIVWWGVLLLADAWNARRRGLSLWRGQAGHFLTITAPASVIVWLLFEALNLPAPQWRYVGRLPGVWEKVLFGFVAFSTVIPIMVESWWVIAGAPCVPARLLRWFRRHRAALMVAAAFLAAIPFFNDVFWLNQGIWLIPALVLMPSVEVEPCPRGLFGRALAVSAVAAGIAWESFNYPARTHWEYLILPDVPHLFYMPLPGYVGFIPFAFSMLAVHQFARRLRPSLWLGGALYAISMGGLYWLTVLYIERGIWAIR